MCLLNRFDRVHHVADFRWLRWRLWILGPVRRCLGHEFAPGRAVRRQACGSARRGIISTACSHGIGKRGSFCGCEGARRSSAWGHGANVSGAATCRRSTRPLNRGRRTDGAEPGPSTWPWSSADRGPTRRAAGRFRQRVASSSQLREAASRPASNPSPFDVVRQGRPCPRWEVATRTVMHARLRGRLPAGTDDPHGWPFDRRPQRSCRIYDRETWNAHC